jgi:hypothetical protein
MGLSAALKGIGGEFELNRVIGFISGLGYTAGALVFTAWNMIEGREFDVVAFCTAFGGGAAFITGGTAAAVSLKDRNVASSKVIEQTGAVPTKAKDGPQVPTGDPPPVDKPHADKPADDLPEYAR